MTRYFGALCGKPGSPFDQALGNALFDNTLGLRQSLGGGNARCVKAERVSIFFDGRSIQN